jgi:pyruvate/2-oxoglutarate dehydrogenase complex dihydrolipoamide acyltransferase (E2) component
VHPSDLIGSFEERMFPTFRNPTIDTLTWGSKRHHILILLELDVTIAREIIRARKKAGQGISFTGWMTKCLALAVSEHKFIHALRRGRRRLVIFEDVDVAIIVERVVDQSSTDETLPMPYIIRKANEKTVAMIHSEIRTAQKQAVSAGEVQIGSTRAAWMTRLYTLPI